MSAAKKKRENAEKRLGVTNSGKGPVRSVRKKNQKRFILM